MLFSHTDQQRQNNESEKSHKSSFAVKFQFLPFFRVTLKIKQPISVWLLFSSLSLIKLTNVISSEASQQQKKSEEIISRKYKHLIVLTWHDVDVRIVVLLFRLYAIYIDIWGLNKFIIREWVRQMNRWVFCYSTTTHNKAINFKHY